MCAAPAVAHMRERVCDPPPSDTRGGVCVCACRQIHAGVCPLLSVSLCQSLCPCLLSLSLSPPPRIRWGCTTQTHTYAHTAQPPLLRSSAPSTQDTRIHTIRTGEAQTQDARARVRTRGSRPTRARGSRRPRITLTHQGDAGSASSCPLLPPSPSPTISIPLSHTLRRALSQAPSPTLPLPKPSPKRPPPSALSRNPPPSSLSPTRPFPSRPLPSAHSPPRARAKVGGWVGGWGREGGACAV